MPTPDVTLHANEILEDLDRQAADRRCRAEFRREQARHLETEARELDLEAVTLETERDTVAARYGLPLRYDMSYGADGLQAGLVSFAEMRAIGNRHEIVRLMAERDPLGEVRVLEACRLMHAAEVITTDPRNVAKSLARAMKKNPIWEEISPGRFRLAGTGKGGCPRNPHPRGRPVDPNQVR